MLKMVSLDAQAETLGDVSWETMRALGELTLYDRTAPDEVNARIGDAEVVFSTKVPLGEENFVAAPALRLICLFATGYNVIDVEAAKQRGILVCNVPGYSTEPVAQHAFALLLELANRVGHYSAEVRAGRWTNCPDFTFLDQAPVELWGKTLGVIGYGSIGRRVAEIGAAFGMRVLYNRRAGASPDDTDRVRYAPLDALLRESDFVSVHCPLNDETRGLLGAENIAKMKRGAFLVNTARGPIVDDAALAAALASGQIGGAGLDVLSVEPPREGSPLFSAPNCFVTPHIAWASHEARTRLMAECVENVRAYLNGKPRFVVNP